MTRFVALLGGINVGGHRVTMDRLRAEVASLGYTDVTTFIASGNVIFTAPARGDHETRLATHLGEALGWPAPTYLRTARELVAATDLRPFGPTPDGYTHMVAFCRNPPPEAISELSTTSDRFEAHGRELHWLIDGKLTDSKVTLPKLVKMVGPNTTRNVTSLERLAALVR
ncbi:MAG TPA: DUF1697 domain-containing protein [Ilumatobacteraceae bacterium]|nr:DUF1697 domain-containing protein [Ilumatobacteraceae bacterium]